MKPLIAILISGSGTNMAALAEAVAAGELNAEIAFVGSDKESAAGLIKAEKLGLRTKVFSYKNGKAAAEEDIAASLTASGSEWVVLAGYMRILSPDFVKKYPQRIVNIHPSLLPSFPGAHAIDDAWNSGVKVTGVTIHMVDEFVDHGRILAQQAVDISEDDTLETLGSKIHRTEHQLYKSALKKLFAVYGTEANSKP